MEIKPKTGFVIVEVLKRGGRGRMVCAHTNESTGDTDGISGFLYMYYTKKEAAADAKKLEQIWNDGTRFIVVKATVRV